MSLVDQSTASWFRRLTVLASEMAPIAEFAASGDAFWDDENPIRFRQYNVIHQYNLGGPSTAIPASVFADSLADEDWKPGTVPNNIDTKGAFVVEVGAMRMVSGAAIGDAGALSQMSAQAALMLVDIGTAPGGYGNRYGEDFGGAT